MVKPAAQPNQSLIDGLAVLQALAVASEPIGSRDMARRLNLEPTRVNRLLKTLASIGIAQQMPDRRYIPGTGMHVLSAAAMQGSGIVRQSVPVLERLRQHKLDVAMGVLWQAQVCYLYHAGLKTPPADALGGRGLFAAEHSGIGLALLATVPDVHVESLYADRSPTDRETVLKRVRQTRRQAYAYLPVGPGRTSSVVGVAVGEPAVAAIALSGDFGPDRVPDLANELKQAAAEISAGMHR